jgi:hypothetical protein
VASRVHWIGGAEYLDQAKRGEARENTVETGDDRGSTEGSPSTELRNAMAAKIKSEMSVGLTPEIEEALKVATDFVGMKPSQFGRQAILEKLVREGFLRHPSMRHETPQAAE